MDDLPAIRHPNMSPAWFDQAVHRAHSAGCHAIPTGKPGEFYVTSTSSNAIYTVTRTACTCKGHENGGKCLHRALVCFELDALRAEPIARGA